MCGCEGACVCVCWGSVNGDVGACVSLCAALMHLSVCLFSRQVEGSCHAPDSVTSLEDAVNDFAEFGMLLHIVADEVNLQLR